MSTCCNTTANKLVPQTDPEAIIRQANAQKRRIKANIKQHLLGLATGAINPPSESFDPNFLTTKSFLTGTSSTSQTTTLPTPLTTPDPAHTAPHSPLTDKPSITITQPPSPRIVTPPQPTFNPLGLPSPFLKHNMDNVGLSKGGNTPMDPATGGSMLTDDYLKVLFATQQASLAQVQANREEYNRRLARQDADAAVRLAESTSRIARLEEALIGMTIKSQTPERQISSAGDDVNLQTFRTSDGPADKGPYQEVKPFLLWLNSLN
ncbi:hypothetical protein Pst134EA_025567 [Puccinia striiformis f. sp. tritici]|uniref:hypothetical protein n=1 Tax=Puccinia striiformis f. sp. tritici TaxID=168172 RepID=UPI002007AB46|nr:hypothetical protein Pst134EA_025567 [Puccinia striiformis f. sp. tritici]KAH9451619.1 hypothetical protein Pst134EA_025567 [Puccinia striiformis f. sp. tritici]